VIEPEMAAELDGPTARLHAEGWADQVSEADETFKASIVDEGGLAVQSNRGQALALAGRPRAW
jgi:hypothetical protein